MRKFQFGCGVIAQNFLLNYFFFKMTLNPSKKVKFPSETPKDVSNNGMIILLKVAKTFSRSWKINLFDSIFDEENS